MSEMMFYERVVALNDQTHAQLKVRPATSFAYAAKTNSVPLLVSEFFEAAREYPIIFARGEAGPVPAALLGLREAENLYVGGEGKWDARYVPAFVRRYPFVFSASPDGETLTLCIDEAYGGFDPTGRRGERMFDDAGARTPSLERALEFTRTFQSEHGRSRRFASTLKDLGLLVPALARGTARGTGGDGGRRSLTGFHCVDRAKLKALANDVIADLLRTDALELVHLHLLSLRNFDRLAESRDARPATASVQ